MKLVYSVYSVEVKNGASYTEGMFLLYNDEGYMVDEWHGLSGGWGYGSLPHGIYEMRNARYLPDTEEFKAFKYSGKPWGIDLIPQFKTHRMAIMMHADGGLQGTLGCTSPQRTEDDIQVFTTLKPLIDSGNLKTLEVL